MEILPQPNIFFWVQTFSFFFFLFIITRSFNILMILQRRRITYQVWILPLLLLVCLQHSPTPCLCTLLLLCVYHFYPWISLQTYLWVPQYLQHFDSSNPLLPESTPLPTIPPHYAFLSTALLHTFRWALLKVSILRLLVYLVELTKPLLTAHLLQQHGVWSSIISYAAVSILGAIAEQRQIDVRDRLVLQIRMALTALVHDRSFCPTDDLHEKAQQSTHLLAHHIGQLSGNCWLPLRVLGGLLVFYQQVGMTMIPGVLFILLYVPLRRALLARRTRWQGHLMDCVNRRTRLLETMVEQLGSLRMMGRVWINRVVRKIALVRNHQEWEHSRMATRMDHLLSVARNTCRSGGPLLSLLLCRWWFADRLAADRVYVVQTVLRELFPLLLDVPHAFDGWWAAQRPYRQLNQLYQQSQSQSPRTYRLPPFEISANELIAVVGRVGTGKSWLLDQITLGSQQPVGYVGQQPWILNDTLQTNITFGQTFDPKWYQECLEISGLQHDLLCGQLAQAQDVSSDTLSGGQQMRVALARALYSRSSLLVLDNILASVDIHVSQSIIDQLIRSKRQSVVIVTQDTEVLGLADRVCLVENKEYRLKTLKEWMQLENFCQRAGLLNYTATSSHVNKLPTPPQSSSSSTVEASKKAPAIKAPSPHWMAPIRYLVGLCGWHLILLHTAVVIFQCLVSQQSHLSLSHLEPLNRTLFWWISDIVLDYISNWVTDVGWRRPIFYQSHNDILHSLPHISVQPTGHILSLFTDQQTNLDKQLPARLSQTSVFLIRLSYEFWVILMFHPLQSLILLLVFGLMYWVVTITNQPLSQILQKQAELAPRIAAHIQETRQSHLTVRAMKSERFMCNRLTETISQFINYQRLGDSIETWIDLMMSVLRELSVIMAFVLSATIIESVDVTQLSLVYLSVTYQLARIQHLVRHSHTLQSSLCKAHRYMDSINSKSPSQEEIAVDGDIVFDNVSARYSQDTPQVLRNVSLRIPRGQHIGIVGRTGAGKTSLVMAFLGLLPLDAGTIRIGPTLVDGRRPQIHVVPQRPVLIPGTLRDNLSIDPLPDNQLARALRRVLLPDNLPLDSALTEAEWSPGQLQLLCLARALLSEAPIVVLDEPTASVDTVTAQHLYQVVQRHFKNRTVIVIAHRMLDTMMDSLHSILRVDNGTIN